MSDIALSLGEQPISNRLPRAEKRGLALAAAPYPLGIVICDDCALPQLAHDLAAEENFHDDYTYVSGASSTWSIIAGSMLTNSSRNSASDLTT